MSNDSKKQEALLIWSSINHGMNEIVSKENYRSLRQRYNTSQPDASFDEKMFKLSMSDKWQDLKRAYITDRELILQYRSEIKNEIHPCSKTKLLSNLEVMEKLIQDEVDGLLLEGD